ncbi:MAG TPA: YbaK/EbsC family protein [Terriglobia bacterium]|nr:YbaK/EbsC family protein [Terriglobia bacterium]
MYLLSRVKQYLDKEGVPYEHHVHRTAYTAQEVAAEEHIPGKMMAKTVLLKTATGLVMVVLPASSRLDLEAARRILGDPEARLASELEFTGAFPDCDVGAMPPFGNLYGIPVYVDAALAEDEEIVFNAGTHQDSIRMKYADFARLAKPTVGGLALSRAA